jgi:hypothetical protein
VLFNISLSPAQSTPAGNFNISVQVEAPDLVAALEAAKEPIRKSAETQALALHSALPAPEPSK